ncbi:hypothetical protein [Staphylococcus xylosus]|uniref:hypothetical protein n=1 Tax=Staphylococcus xylosus TaxID=1288 RepID=UPI00034980CE|nr:hypothetical protein [Staphylococcus xylosus]
MVKIKRKVEMTCGEFAKYMVDKFGFSSYEIKLSDGYWVGNPEREYDVSIHLPPSKVSDLPDIKITESGVVIFEVEEEITEDTVLEKAIEVYSDKYDNFLATSCEGKSVKDILDSNVGNDTKTEKIYLFNDDDTMTLIWRDGKLVE